MQLCRSYSFNFNFLIQISLLEAFTRPCNVSQQTVTLVSKCPTNLSSYETAAKNKNCSLFAEEAKGCKPLQYHCVLSEDLKYAIEVCAPSIYIIDHVCAKFSNEHKSIMRVEGLNCSKCPYSYNSTLAFEYLQCYSNLTQPLTTERAQSTTRTTYGTGTSKDRNSDVTSTSLVNIAVPVPVIVVIAIALGIIILAASIYLFVKKFRKVYNQSGNYKGYVIVPQSEYGDVQYHSQRRDVEEHVDIPQFDSVGSQQLSENGSPVMISQCEVDGIQLPNPNDNQVATLIIGAVGCQCYNPCSDNEGNDTNIQLDSGMTQSPFSYSNYEITQETVPDIVRSPYPYENIVTTPEPVSTLEENQKLEQLRAKLDSFNLSRKSKYIGYTKYDTRVKSFEQNETWSEDKKKEFSTYGFLYGGFDLNTKCFHCGCIKDDWRDTDNILETHVSLSESCAYINYIKSLSEPSQ